MGPHRPQCESPAEHGNAEADWDIDQQRHGEGGNHNLHNIEHAYWPKLEHAETYPRNADADDVEGYPDDDVLIPFSLCFLVPAIKVPLVIPAVFFLTHGSPDCLA